MTAEKTSSMETVGIGETTHAGQHALVITTPTATYYYQTEAGGFSSIHDASGIDWVGFCQGPPTVPEGAAHVFRGLPNLVLDGNIGHPGYKNCTTAVVRRNHDFVTLETHSNDSLWSWQWTFTPDSARLDVTATPAGRCYWFQYEGIIGGDYSPQDSVWATDLHPASSSVPTIDYSGEPPVFAPVQWAAFSRRGTRRWLCVRRLTGNGESALMSYMPAQRGRVSEPNGMVVFGFGREPGNRPALTGPHSFVIGFLENLSEKNKIEITSKTT